MRQKQKYAFLSEEGDRWFERNREKLAQYSIETDPVIAAIRGHGLKPKRALEIGCGNGLRLAALRDAYDCEIMGIEPSMEAACDAASRRVPVVQATASSPTVQGPFDLLIYGHCLYLTDPDDWLQVAAEGNALLATDGNLIIHDFWPATWLNKRQYEHRDGIWSYHYDWARLWLSHPSYREISRKLLADDQSIVVLRKGSMP